MTAETRRAVAYIAGRLISGKQAKGVHDHQGGGHTSFSGNVSANQVSVYDHGRGCHVSGSPSSLYDHGGSHHIQLNVDGQQFSGYDYGSNAHLNGRVSGTSVSVYDYEHGAHFNYSL